MTSAKRPADAAPGPTSVPGVGGATRLLHVFGRASRALGLGSPRLGSAGGRLPVNATDPDREPRCVAFSGRLLAAPGAAPMARAIVLLLLLLPAAVSAGETKCEERTVSGHHARMCMYNPGMFRHWTFSLEVDGETIFSLIDDYSEKVSLTHVVPDGPALELSLSRQGGKTVSITGGCVPVLGDRGTEVARQCDFSWGNVKIVDAVRFVHEN